MNNERRMKMSELIKQVEEIIRTVAKLKTPELDPHKPLKELGVDSLEVMNIFLVIAERFSIEIPDEEIDRLDTIGKIAAYLSEQH